MGPLYPFTFPRRPYQMWYVSRSTPQQHPSRQTHRERGGGKRFRISYNGKVSK
jgi:hypothetical protein